MAVAFLQEFAGTGDTSTTNYDAVAARIDEQPWPEGCLAHTAGFAPDGTFRIYDIWDTQAHLDAFVNGTLMPLVEELFADRPDAPPPAKQEMYELHDSRVAGQ
jgi:hypothetical protein